MNIWICLLAEPKLPEEGEAAEDNDELKEEEGKENKPEDGEDSSEDEEDGEGQGESKPEDMEVDDTENQQEEDKNADTGELNKYKNNKKTKCKIMLFNKLLMA